MSRACWQEIWESKAAEADFPASGRSSGGPHQLFALLADACAALTPRPWDRLLDLGCGVGLLARHLAPYVGSFVGVDFAPSLLRRASRAAPTARFVAGTLSALPFADGAFSKILASSVLQYLDDDEAVGHALREMRRVVATGGRVFASGNPDRRKKDDYIAGIDRLDLPEDRKAMIRERNHRAFWMSPDRLVEQARAVGWDADIRAVSHAVWQSFYMFDVFLTTR